MSAKKGYFSLVQFCPNPSRLEAVNVGVVLFCPDSNFIAARMSDSNARAKQFFGRDQIELAGLASAKVAFQKGFEVERSCFRNLSDLQQFADTRAGSLRLTAPRPVKVFDTEKDLQRLFDELVGDHENEVTKEQDKSEINKEELTPSVIDTRNLLAILGLADKKVNNILDPDWWQTKNILEEREGR